MNKNNNDSFDAYIKSRFEAMEYDGPIDAELDRMSTTLNGKKFFKFSLKQFNIYYLMSILLVFNLFVVYKFGNGQKKSKEFQYNSIFKESKDTLIKVKDSSKNEVYNELLFRKKTNAQLELREDLTQRRDSVSGVYRNESKMLSDSINSIIPNQEDLLHLKKVVDSTPVKKIKKIRYLNVRDTIIKMDTNKVRRRR